MTNAEANDTATAVAEQGATVAPKKAASKKAASRKKGAPQGQKRAKGAQANKPAKKAQKSARQQAPRTIGKGAKILELIGRAKGATLAEIMKAVAWQAHSVRGFISTAGKKHSVKIESSKSEAGDRVYKIVK